MDDFHKINPLCFVLVVIVVIVTPYTHAISTDQKHPIPLSGGCSTATLSLSSTNGGSAGDKMATAPEDAVTSSKAGENNATDLNARGKSISKMKSSANEDGKHGFNPKKHQFARRIRRSLPSQIATRGGNIAEEDGAIAASQNVVLSMMDPGARAPLLDRGAAESPYSSGRISGMDPMTGSPRLHGDTSERIEPTGSALDRLLEIGGTIEERLSRMHPEPGASQLDGVAPGPFYSSGGAASMGYLQDGSPGSEQYRDAPEASESDSLASGGPYDDTTVTSWIHKRNRIAAGFLGMRGKKDLLLPKRVFHGFLGMRGKKAAGSAAGGANFIGGFLGMRGKRELWLLKRSPLPEAYYRMRGKKDADQFLEDSTPGGNGWKLSEQDGDQRVDTKRIPAGFLGMRGKRDTRSGSLEPEVYAALKRLTAREYGGYRNRMPDGGATYKNFLATRGYMARLKSPGSDRKRQIGSIFVGMRG